MTVTSITATRPIRGLQDPLIPIATHRPRVYPGNRHNPASGLEEAIARAASTADYDGWLDHTASAGGCVSPVQLRGEAHVVSERTGRIISTRHTDDMPDGVLYKACANPASTCSATRPTTTARRSSAPLCAWTATTTTTKSSGSSSPASCGDAPWNAPKTPCGAGPNSTASRPRSPTAR